MPSIEVRGATLQYAQRGQGEDLVLVHGSASDLRTWSGVQPMLGDRYRTLAYSRRYHRPNTPIPSGADYAMDEHVRDLGALLSSLELAPAHLVGHSYGAFVALLLAMREPQLVRRLVLCEPPVLTLHVSTRPRLSELLRLVVTRPRTAWAILAFGARGMAAAMKAADKGDIESTLRHSGCAILGKEAFAGLSPERLEQARANTMTEEFLGSGFPPLDKEALRTLRTPTMLITANKSPAVFHRLSERLAELLPDVECHTLAGASHLLHEDQPRAFTAAVSTFLASDPPATEQGQRPPATS